MDIEDTIKAAPGLTPAARDIDAKIAEAVPPPGGGETYRPFHQIRCPARDGWVPWHDCRCPPGQFGPGAVAVPFTKAEEACRDDG
jgi:hypothetical protein